MKNPFPAYQWYARDYLSSSAHATMTLEEQGAYRNLLDRAWIDDPPCSLPDDDEQLAMLSGAGTKWPAMNLKLRQWFTPRRGRLWNEKQLKNFRELLSLRATRTRAGIIAGRKSAEARAKAVNQTMTIEQTKPNPATASSSASSEEEDSLFTRVWALYPRRAGANPRGAALESWRARRKDGVSAQELESAVERYSRFCQATGKIGTETVQQAASFFGPKKAGWKETWELPLPGGTNGKAGANRPGAGADAGRYDAEHARAAEKLRRLGISARPPGQDAVPNVPPAGNGVHVQGGLRLAVASSPGVDRGS